MSVLITQELKELKSRIMLNVISYLWTHSESLKNSTALGEDVLAIVSVDEHRLQEIRQELLHARHCASCFINSGKIQQNVKGCGNHLEENRYNTFLVVII